MFVRGGHARPRVERLAALRCVRRRLTYDRASGSHALMNLRGQRHRRHANRTGHLSSRTHVNSHKMDAEPDGTAASMRRATPLAAWRARVSEWKAWSAAHAPGSEVSWHRAGVLLNPALR